MIKKSAKFDYACRSLLELALHWPSQEPLQVNEIAKRQRIPMNFLIHILISLKQQGFVKSTRGNKGGYVLAKAPSDITLKDLWNGFSGENAATLKIDRNKDDSHQVMGLIWHEVDTSLSELMTKFNFEEICNRTQAHSKNLSYEI